MVDITGTPRPAMTVNGQLPAPALRLRECPGPMRRIPLLAECRNLVRAGRRQPLHASPRAGRRFDAEPRLGRPAAERTERADLRRQSAHALG